jgi:hypothetical protein
VRQTTQRCTWSACSPPPPHTHTHTLVCTGRAARQIRTRLPALVSLESGRARHTIKKNFISSSVTPFTDACRTGAVDARAVSHKAISDGVKRLTILAERKEQHTIVCAWSVRNRYRTTKDGRNKMWDEASKQGQRSAHLIKAL